MKFTVVSILLAFLLAVGVDSASVSLSSNQLTLNGNAQIQFYGPKEAIWAGLSNGHRYPTINSGDKIALRLAYTSGSLSQYWLYCAYTCTKYTCPGTIMSSSKWSSCSSVMMFHITAKDKMSGQPINSGDTVSLSSYGYGASRRLYCGTSSSTKCSLISTTSSMTGNNWLVYTLVTFQIFARDAVDGTPVQYGDVVGFKYPYSSYSSWLYYNSNYYYARSCSANSKSACAKENAVTGFRIFKQL